jgi:hypothetical protein
VQQDQATGQSVGAPADGGRGRKRDREPEEDQDGGRSTKKTKTTGAASSESGGDADADATAGSSRKRSRGDDEGDGEGEDEDAGRSKRRRTAEAPRPIAGAGAGAKTQQHTRGIAETKTCCEACRLGNRGSDVDETDEESTRCRVDGVGRPRSACGARAAALAAQQTRQQASQEARHAQRRLAGSDLSGQPDSVAERSVGCGRHEREARAQEGHLQSQEMIVLTAFETTGSRSTTAYRDDAEQTTRSTWP